MWMLLNSGWTCSIFTICVNMFNIHSFKCSIHATRSNIPTMILICSIDTFNKFNICANSLYWISIVHQQKGKWERLHQGGTTSQFRFKIFENITFDCLYNTLIRLKKIFQMGLPQFFWYIIALPVATRIIYGVHRPLMLIG